MGVAEFLGGAITSLSTLIAWSGGCVCSRYIEAGVFVCEMVTYLAADEEDRVLVTEPEQVLAATVRFWDRAKKHLPG
jgi:hypothetical protein